MLYHTLCSSQSKCCSCDSTVRGVLDVWPYGCFGISTRWRNVVKYILWSLYPGANWIGGWVGRRDGEKISWELRCLGLLRGDNNSEERSSHLLRGGSLKSRNFLFPSKHSYFRIHILKFYSFAMIDGPFDSLAKNSTKNCYNICPQINYWSWEVNTFRVVCAWWKWD